MWLVQLICFQWDLDLFWLIGPFNYCTLGHWCRDHIVWLSVGSITWSFVSFFHSLVIICIVGFGIASLANCLIWYIQLLQSSVCMVFCVYFDNWVGFITKLNCQMDFIKTIIFCLTSFFFYILEPIIFWFPWLLRQFVASGNSWLFLWLLASICFYSDGHFCFLSYRQFLYHIWIGL